MKNKKTINRVLQLIRPYTYLVVSILVLAAVTVAATLYSPILIGKGVDCMIEKGLVSFPDLKLVLLQLAGNLVHIGLDLGILCLHCLQPVSSLFKEAQNSLFLLLVSKAGRQP